ncbi:scopoletin glucosyltransferase-like [Papaver somniferum]|uniref:scopoletin glucosyltransferase-like n=1 Tax=Papaver somniferum TaxID=3469 RepID=UPI000E7036EA|nr:scopoletin glucosyltransferase-like [Papaver somniferum]
MGSETITGHQQLHVYLFPVPAQGHMIPTVDVAKLLAARGLKSTVICTPLNAVSISKTTERDRLSGLDINVQTIPFPAAEVGLPEGIESMDKITSPEMVPKFMTAIALLQQPFEQLLEEHRPDFVIAGMFLPWATESAAKFSIPRIVFHGTSSFALSIGESLKLYKPYEAISVDADPDSSFVIPGLPDKIEMTMAQLPDHLRGKNVFSEMMEKVRESELNSYGVLVNSFYELEPAYAEHYRNILGRKTWHIGPVSLRNTDTSDKAQRGKKSTIDEHYVLNWLNSKEPNSVLYVSFGSVSRVSNNQLLELAMGLENSGYSFIWVVRQIKNDDEESFLPKGFEERIEGKGLIIRDWAPQVLILDHEAVGGFMTHCGWNSTLEGISAGVPMITWPMFAEQFHNEKFITQVIKIGAPLGAKEYNMWVDAKKVSLVMNETIATVVTQLMGDGEEAKEMRQRAKEIGEMAKRSVEEGGSSHTNLTTFIEEMKVYSKK